MRPITLLAVVLAFAPPVGAQVDRRDRQEPELSVETGARTGTCDALQFSRDGKFLLAAGDDKVVRSWPVGPRGFDRKNATVLRWPAWREQRGGIKAMGLPLDPTDRRVAIGGYGSKTTTVAVLDRDDGTILHLATPAAEGRNFFAVMAVAWAPSGERIAFGTGDGSVFVWNLAEKAPQRLGGHKTQATADATKDPFDRVRLVAFLDEKKILTAAEKGQVKEWDADLAEQPGTPLFDLLPELPDCPSVFRVALSPDRSKIVATGSGPSAVVKPLAGGDSIPLHIAKGTFYRAAAWNHDGSRLALAYNRPIADTGDYFLEGDDEIKLVTFGETVTSRPGPPHSGRVEALAWNANGSLAIAGGEHHPVTLYADPTKAGRPTDFILDAGRCLYGVRLSDDGRYVAFRAKCDAKATHPNERGAGEWSYFDLQRRRPVARPADVAFSEPARGAAGWTIKPDPDVRWKWYAVTPDGKPVALPWDVARDETPRCYAFLSTTTAEVARVAVGHYYGFSVFEVSAAGARRVFLGTGHTDEVLALAPSADGTWVVTAGRDQTLAAWSLKPWPSQEKLGAAFGDSLEVTAVDVGSPSWEAGLVVGDEVTLLAVGGKLVFDAAKNLGSAAEALAALRAPSAGKELYFGLKRKGANVVTLTTVRQRPLWRLFPGFAGGQVNEWVLWMWRNSFYQSSTNGDSMIGWHVNHPTEGKEPTFYRAEAFRKLFSRPDVIGEVIRSRDVGSAFRQAMGNNPVQIHFGSLEPAPARIELASKQVGADGLKIELIVQPRGVNPDVMPKTVELWCEDYRLARWDAGGKAFHESFTLQPGDLREGINEVTLQAINEKGGRSEYTVKLQNVRKSGPRRMFGLGVGINDYKGTATPGQGDGARKFGDLRAARNDAEQLRTAWEKQKGKKLYGDVRFETHFDAAASRDQILKSLDDLAKMVTPDDQVVVFLSGHGDFLQPKGTNETLFVFCCPTYQPEQYNDTGISTAELYERLAAIRGRKLVILDACHSGQAAINPVRSLTPNNKGPIILAACDMNEFAFEHPNLGNGLFTYAMLEALGVNSAQADGRIDEEQDGMLDAPELFEYVRGRMPSLLREIGRREDQQTPVCFPRQPERFPVAQR